MPEVMSGIPMSAFLWMLLYAVMCVPVVAFYAILFSVGSGLGPKEEKMIYPISGKPRPKEESPPIRHAA